MSLHEKGGFKKGWIFFNPIDAGRMLKIVSLALMEIIGKGKKVIVILNIEY